MVHYGVRATFTLRQCKRGKKSAEFGDALFSPYSSEMMVTGCGKKFTMLLGGKRPWYWYGSNSKALESLIGRGESVGKARRDNTTTKRL